MEFTNQTLLYGLFNQYVFSEAKMNLDYLKMYYKDKRILNNNTLITKLLKLIENYSYIELTESRFMLTLQQDNRTVEEAKMIYDKIREYQQYDRQQSSVFIENLKSLCYTAFINRVQEHYSENPVKYMEELKKFDYKSNYSDTLVAKNFAELDITDLVDRYSAQGYKSRYQFVNDSFTCGGYIPGQLVLVCGAPGTGKSLFLQSEAVNFIEQGKRVHLLVMGDLSELDLATRMLCQMAHKTQRAVESDIIGNFNKYKDKFQDFLTITCVPSGLVSSRDYVDWIKQRIDEYDVLMIDYYSNFKAGDDGSMYTSGGITCDALTELTREGKLVFLACQPKISYFGEELLTYESIGESSRLIHIADMILTIGRCWDAGMRMGQMNIAKNRRGDTNKAYWIGTNEGLFYNCSDVLYAKYKNNKSQRKLFSYDELTTMDIIDTSISDIMESSLIE